ncbi:hypothetical protein LNQ81_16445 [Myroides sp. M-43]|nr:hypothetical protein [Myroides oncorhynchi]MCC9044263.1 hypothetical protein [Myroides oncorhynchi]
MKKEESVVSNFTFYQNQEGKISVQVIVGGYSQISTSQILQSNSTS